MKRTPSRRDNEAERCTFIRAQRATHLLTLVYNKRLEPAGLTNAQFALLAYLSGPSGNGERSAPVSALERHAGLDRQALYRELRLLAKVGLLSKSFDATEPTKPSVAITDKGLAKFHEALPLWTSAKTAIEALLGESAAHELNGLLELALVKLESVPPKLAPKGASSTRGPGGRK